MYIKKCKVSLKIGVLIMLFVCISNTYTSEVQAYKTTGHVLTGGVGNYGYTKRYYWIDSSCTSTMKKDINKAWEQWTYTTSSLKITTPISIKETTTKSQSVFDIYYKKFYEEEEGVFGVTLYWKKKAQVSQSGYMPNVDWGWTQIMLNKPNYAKASRNDNGLNRQKHIVAHEIGHAMGLCHQNSSTRLMHPYANTAAVDSCTADELNGINSLYK